MTRRTLLTLTALLLAPPAARAADEPRPVRVVVWDEQQPAQKEAYANFLGNAIADHLKSLPGITVKSVRLDDPEQGLSKDTLDNADVLIWWGHVRHREIKPETAKALVARIKEGKLSLISLHSAHWSVPFVEAMAERARLDAAKELKGKSIRAVIERGPVLGVVPKATDPITPSLMTVTDAGRETAFLTLPNCIFPSYRNDGKPSHVTVLAPDHPLAKGLPATFDIPKTEMYAEPFHVPTPDAVVLGEKWDLGEHFRSACVWDLGKGKVIYFRPGHETYPVFKQAEPLKFLENAVRWLGAK